MLKYEQLEGMSVDDIAVKMIEEKLTKDSSISSVVKHFKPLNAQRMYNLLKQCCKSIGYELNYENIYGILNDNRVILIIATAGSGKTTFLCVKLLREILLKGTNPNKICVLSFNRSSVRDLKRKLTRTMEGFNIVCRRFGIFLDTTELPIIRSLNSLTYNIVDQFRDKFGIGQLSIITEEEASNLMSKVITAKAKDMNHIFSPTEEMTNSMLSLFDLLNETLDDIGKYEKTSLIAGCGLNLQVAKEILQSYRNLLNIQGKLSHSDTCRIILEACERDEEFKAQLQSFYELVVIDEVQDVSEATFRLLKLLTGEENGLWAVGDGDQSIYKFKGSRPNNCQLFSQDFEDAVVCNLSLNRRCRANILKMANLALNSMTDRSGVLPRASKDGGEVIHKLYTSKLDVVEEIALKLKTVDKNDLGNYAIGYRKNFSAFYIVNTLLSMGIPFQIKDDFQPGNDLLSRSINGIMSLLKSPGNKGLIANNLYKITGVAKKPPLDMVNKVLCKNYSEKDLVNIEIIESYYDEVMDEEDCDYFFEIPTKYFRFSSKASAQAIEEEFKNLEKLHKLIKKQTPLKDVVPQVLEFFEKNFWGYMRKRKSFPQEFEDMIISDWMRDMTYVEYKHMKAKQEDDIKAYTSAGKGIQLSTMHTLKGLEFDTTFIIELEGDTMPLIKNASNMTSEECEEALNEELRLLYVAMTRAKDTLCMYWSSTNISEFYPLAEDYQALSSESTADTMKAFEDSFSFSQELDFNIGSEETGFNYNIDLSLNNVQNAILLGDEPDSSLTIESIDLAVDIDTESNKNVDIVEVASETELSLDINADITSPSSLKIDLDSEKISEPLSLDLTSYQEPLSLDLSVESVGSDLSLDITAEEEKLILDLPDELEDSTQSGILATEVSSQTSSEHSEPVDSSTSEDTNSSLIENTIKTISDRAFNDTQNDLPEYKSSDDTDYSDAEEYLDLLHPDEDFVELEQGNALQSVLKIICREIEVN